MFSKIADRVLRLIMSRGFYWFILVFFVFESVWIALTAAYPQAFDEQFHFGLIQLYSHHLSPFLAKQPAHANQFGAVARDPSYLYHYLMSFPYRFIELLTKRQAYQVIFLRFIDIALFTWGLVLFRKILLRVKLSKQLANVALLIFALIPIVPQLAGQINYDNLFFPLVAIVTLLCFRLIDQIKRSELRFTTVLSTLVLATLTSLIKYAFLPIFLAIIVFFTIYILHGYRQKLGLLVSNFVISFKKANLLLKIGLIAGMVVAIGLFAQRDIVNLIDYHTIVPDCSQVLTNNDCQAYTVWQANYSRHQIALANHITPSHNPFIYTGQWLYWMWYRLFFAINGPNTSYTNYPPLPLPSAIALVIGLVGLIAVIKYRNQIFKGNAYAGFILVACLFYIIALMADGYSSYRFTAVLEDMNGRYLLPILLLIGALFAKALSIALKKSSHLKVAIAIVVVLLFLEGGGILTFIARSDNSWYWQNSKAIKVNNVAQKITRKVIFNGRNTYNTNVWFFN